MTNPSSDAGVIAMLLERFTKQRLPRAMNLKEKVDRGECLSDWELAHLEEVLADAQQILPIVDRHPEYEELAERAIALYAHISEQALKNEKGT